MAIFYKLRFRKKSANSEKTGYYAVVCNKGMVGTDDVAEEIQRNCSMKRSDVLAVLAELSEVLKQNIQQSHSVKLNGIGVFRPGICSTLAESIPQFNASTNIKSLRLNFLPESVTQGNVRTKKVFVGARVSQEGLKKNPEDGEHKEGGTVGPDETLRPDGTSPNPDYNGGKDTEGKA